MDIREVKKDLIAMRDGCVVPSDKKVLREAINKLEEYEAKLFETKALLKAVLRHVEQ